MEYALSFTERPIVDTLTALIADNLFGRFPAAQGADGRVRLVVGRGAAAQARSHRAAAQSKDMWRFGAPPLKPSDTLPPERLGDAVLRGRRAGLVKQLGAEHVLAGSDYPHPEGLLWPAEFADELVGLTPDVVRRILRDNLAELVCWR